MKLELQPLKELIKLRCGLVFDGISEENLHRAVLARMEKCGTDQHEYFQQVVAQEEEFDELVAKYRAYMRYNAYFSDWIWVYGQFPA